ncbi:hypothetical protein JR316_0002265 [Psilocybe cubensis]|uniref:Uncharacterized protein n=2 Tax=Psilocybe cubensis TaxID=181762 RepID=A0ACB8HCC6_PSICU|nr:hypothetical protein JR316_0002265 [Psilocybe cubensis]KAH9485357.1 hypothetical protein JR316_0002265 [Psilocybe cubensis]
MSSAALHHPSPAQHEQDIAHTQSWFDDDFTESHMNASHRKGKGKRRSGGHDTDPTSPASSSDNLDKIAYPPVNEDAEETRRVEENLRRWEIAERQRRKAARGSTQSAKASSLIEDVSKRASLLWPGKKTKHSSIGGSHTALESQDHIDVVPLNQVVTASPVLSPTHSNSDVPTLQDPFANPPELISPFADSFQVATLVPPSATEDGRHLSAPLNDVTDTDGSNGTAHASKPQRPPAPMPLNLPPPRTPPMGSPLMSPINDADAQRREEPQRAGRTNPQE